MGFLSQSSRKPRIASAECTQSNFSNVQTPCNIHLWILILRTNKYFNNKNVTLYQQE